ncbi:MAG: acetate/propionate family kinase [Thermoplasmata archaeon]
MSRSPQEKKVRRGSTPGSAAAPVIVALNIGSSSLKFALFERVPGSRHAERCASGRIEGIGSRGGTLVVYDRSGTPTEHIPAGAPSRASAVEMFLSWIESSGYRDRLVSVGHRIVHGGRSCGNSQPVTPRLLRTLRSLSSLDPDHLPAEIDAIRRVERRFPHLLQVACFDTAFHRSMPPVAQRYALPRRWYEEGVLRYGFHGLSCRFILEALASAVAPDPLPERIVVAHLGSGCSLTAIRNGRSRDTTMGFTPTGGLVMSTRSGDLDPEVVLYLSRHPRRSPPAMSRLLNQEAGLLGVSGTTGDMRVLLQRQRTDRRAREAVDLFCYHAGKALGSLTSVLGGLDTLVFTGGIGENAPEIRRRISEWGVHLGVRIDPRRNADHRAVISSRGSRVSVRVIPTDEERVIAQDAFRVWSSRTRPPVRSRSSAGFRG